MKWPIPSYGRWEITNEQLDCVTQHEKALSRTMCA